MDFKKICYVTVLICLEGDAFGQWTCPKKTRGLFPALSHVYLCHIVKCVDAVELKCCSIAKSLRALSNEELLCLLNPVWPTVNGSEKNDSFEASLSQPLTDQPMLWSPQKYLWRTFIFLGNRIQLSK